VEAVARRVVELIGSDGNSRVKRRLVDAATLAVELGVERSWVYAHRCELGGMQLGTGPKPRLRFDLATAREAISHSAGSHPQGLKMPMPGNTQPANVGQTPVRAPAYYPFEAWRARLPPGSVRDWLSALRRRIELLGLGYRVGELVQVGIEGEEETLNGAPLNAPASSLDARDVGRVDLKEGGELLLRDAGPVAQGPKCTAEHDQVGVWWKLGHDKRLGIPGQVAIRCSGQNIVGARAGRTAGRRGTESLNSRRKGTLSRRRGCPSRQSCLPEPPTKGGTDMNIVTVPAHLVGPLRSGLHSALGDAAEVIAQSVSGANRERHPERYQEPLAHFDQVRAVLNLIGWSKVEQATDVHIDLCEHGQAVLAGLRVAMIVGASELDEVEPVDAERATRGEPPKRDATERRVCALRKFVTSVEASADDSGEPQR
jgi:hypothetical protein